MRLLHTIAILKLTAWAKMFAVIFKTKQALYYYKLMILSILSIKYSMYDAIGGQSYVVTLQ